MKIYSIALMILFALALHGWGSLALAWFYGKERPVRFAYPVVMGMAIWIFLGAFLQLMGLATGWMIDLMVAVGLALAVWLTLMPVYRREGLVGLVRLLPYSERRDFWLDLSYGVIYGTAIFLFLFLTPAKSFNFGDDLDTYFNLAVALVNYGTLANQTFHSAGISSVGGFPFLQGFFAAHLPIAYIGTMDHVFALLLGLFLLKEMAEELAVPSHALPGAMVLFIVINPQIVNVSVVYTGAVVIMGLFIATIRLFSSLTDASIRQQILASTPVALFVGALLPLKFTFIIFIGIFIIVMLSILPYERLCTRHVILMVLFSAALIAVETLAWGLPFQDKFEIMLGLTKSDIEKEAGNSFIINTINYIKFLTKDTKLFYGASPVYYTLISLLMIISTLWCWRHMRQNKASHASAPAMVALGSAGFITYLLMGPMAGRIEDMDTGIRYAIPTLLGVAPAAIMTIQNLHVQKIHNFFLYGALIAIFAFFSTSFAERIGKAVHHQHVIAFPLASDAIYRNGIQAILEDRHKQELRSIQDRVPPGKSILTMSPSNYHFDFKRNQILLADGGIYHGRIIHLKSTWEEVSHSLVTMGIHSIIWKFQGFGIKDFKYYQNSFNSINPETRYWNRLLYHFLTILVGFSQHFAHEVIGDYLVIDLTKPL
ncbi:MAG: hypothetical protein HQL96_06885 [Magnetococcales bacterium]|nr:hypothetical protein [Magnetococcales bacterium]